jgi:prolyl-tRNA editing enzyme YbaK/EbsC (Cys-tRNA(Pro) deacylase)
MSNAIERFREAAGALGYTVPEVRRFPEGTKTAGDAARAIGCRVDQIVKSLVFLVGDEPVLGLTSGANRVDPVKLGRVAGGGEARRAHRVRRRRNPALRSPKARADLPRPRAAGLR